MGSASLPVAGHGFFQPPPRSSGPQAYVNPQRLTPDRSAASSASLTPQNAVASSAMTRVMSEPLHSGRMIGGMGSTGSAPIAATPPHPGMSISVHQNRVSPSSAIGS